MYSLLFQGNVCTLYIPDEDKVVSVTSEHLEPQVPQKGDRVRQHLHMFMPSINNVVLIKFNY